MPSPTIYLRNTEGANQAGQRHANTWHEAEFVYTTVLDLETAEGTITIRNDAPSPACFKYSGERYQTLLQGGGTMTLTLIDDSTAHSLDLYPHETAAEQHKPFVTLKLTKKTSG